MDLKTFFKENKKAAIAFSGGVDSSYLLYAAIRCGAEVTAYFVKSSFQPEFEREDALRMADGLGAKIRVLEADILADPAVTANPPDRCYYCKHAVFSKIKKAAAEDGYSLILDGTNASDDASDRPGMRALKEMAVRSPLRESGLTKSEIRRLSKEAGLFTWNKPSYACLATRIPSNMKITAERLAKTETAEKFLFDLGFSDFRVRMLADGSAKLQVTSEQFPKVIENRQEILTKLEKLLYTNVFLDMKTREATTIPMHK